jgi:hypothetical protein
MLAAPNWPREGRPMQPNTSDNQFSEHTLRQIAADARRALLRGRYCIERSQVERFRCVEDQPETEHAFGRQLWYFEGTGVDELDRRVRVYGAVEYALQFGLHELVEDGVFDATEQRDRFRHIYQGGRVTPSWRVPLRLLAAASLLGIAASLVAYTVLRWLVWFPPTE